MALSNEEWDTLIRNKIDEVNKLPKDTPVPSPSPPPIPAANEILALIIDHTLLKPDATSAQIDELCDQALKFNFKSCCVNGAYIPQVARRLAGSSTVPCCVVGFPLGASSSKVKAFETRQAISDGAKEIDMVLNIGALKSHNYALVFLDVQSVVSAASGHTVKVILETALLSDDEKIAAAFIAAEAGAAFVKTCTGFSGGAASAKDVALMKKTVQYKGNVRVKASAGIRSLETCLEMLAAGADRIGTSSGVAIMQKAESNSDAY
ncbi:putative deoxyribose-phosphate aldolase [Lyophyllum shimeji]|uniref:deoxyribose-phosphate aldolase n=1 Tax=Lyophyllum shimeji TaxID=47721 RepID=A0A9P3UQ97_LYOSH|nr:putative deoxyribose-phosphate aldolase [Lyophyllum shimeji]